MTKKVVRIIFIILAIQTGLYPTIYLFLDRKFGLLQSKTDAILTNVYWNIEFYTHITLGGLALLIGWTQFSVKLRTNKLRLHRRIGRVYVIASLLSAEAAIYIAFYATGGIIASLGFICLGIVWFSATLKAYIEIKNKRIEEHQNMMIYSYAACFSAVTLRIYFPILNILFHHGIKVYLITSWLCWIPNIIVAFLLVKQIQNHKDRPAIDRPTVGWRTGSFRSRS